MILQDRKIPAFLEEMLIKQYGEKIYSTILEGYRCTRPVTFRVNTLKSDCKTICDICNKEGIILRPVLWSKEAQIVENVREERIRELSVYKNGQIYLQSLSSMIPPIVLEPEKNECILDMAAAPGGKTTQMAALSCGKSQITACEKNSVRAQRLRYNLEKQGAVHVSVMVADARKLDDFFSFDKILLDAPCSGSGTLQWNAKQQKITLELVERSVRTQKALLRKALRLLKPGHEMVYSTCSILENENESVIRSVLKKGEVEVVPLDCAIFGEIPTLPTTLPGTLTIAPNELYEGFFVSKLRRVC